MTNADTGQITQEFSGLTEAEVLERRRLGEGNAVRFQSSRSYLRVLSDNVANPVNITLFFISGVLVGLDLFGDAVFTAGLVLGNVVVGVVQESRAKRQLDRIALLTRPRSTVIRDGLEKVVPPEDLVKDDVFVLNPGDQVQVDGVVLSQAGLSLDESLLTGESDLVRKQAADLVHSGTYVIAGAGICKAQQVGEARLAQQITSQARAYKNVRTPLQREVALIIWLSAAVMALLSLVVIESFRHVYGGLPLVESTRAAAVIVALVPQGLWIMVTVTYAMAIVRLARKGALIQRLNAVESLSHVDVLCMDKTGTLTTNELKLTTLLPLSLEESELRRELGHFAASASFSNRTNSAILGACPGEPCHVAEEVTFDSARKWSAIVFHGDCMQGLRVLGAPEVLMPHLAFGGGIEEASRDWAEQGLRVLLYARRPGLKRAAFDDLEPKLPSGLEPAGLIVLSDELRTDASTTIASFAEAGIGLKIISGDHPETVKSLARQAGFPGDLKVVSGEELDELLPEDTPAVAEEATIFGRVSPRHKQRLLEALQKKGHYVAMIGDGVNDVPALKTAEVAIAVRSGSAVSRGIADAVLLDDSFSALPAAFLEGQRIRKGMETIIRLFLVRSLSVALIILVAALLREEFPVSPRHTAVIAILTVGLPSLALATWAQPGKAARFVLPGALEFVLPAALTIGLTGAAVYGGYGLADAPAVEARTALTVTSTLCGLLLIPYVTLPVSAWLTSAPLRAAQRHIALALAMLLLLAVSIAIPPLRRFYELDVLAPANYGPIALAVSIWALTLKAIWRWLPMRQLRRLAAR